MCCNRAQDVRSVLLPLQRYVPARQLAKALPGHRQLAVQTAAQQVRRTMLSKWHSLYGEHDDNKSYTERVQQGDWLLIVGCTQNPDRRSIEVLHHFERRACRFWAVNADGVSTAKR